jgi:putative oxidoreductase
MEHFFWGDTRDRNLGLLLLRVFAGAAMLTHGIPKMFGGLEKFTGFVASLHIPMPKVMALLAALAESLGAFLLLIGLGTRLASLMLIATMSVAAFIALNGKPFGERELALFYFFTSWLFLLKGGGMWSIDALIKR